MGHVPLLYPDSFEHFRGSNFCIVTRYFSFFLFLSRLFYCYVLLSSHLRRSSLILPKFSNKRVVSFKSPGYRYIECRELWKRGLSENWELRCRRIRWVLRCHVSRVVDNFFVRVGVIGQKCVNKLVEILQEWRGVCSEAACRCMKSRSKVSTIPKFYLTRIWYFGNR